MHTVETTFPAPARTGTGGGDPCGSLYQGRHPAVEGVQRWLHLRYRRLCAGAQYYRGGHPVPQQPGPAPRPSGRVRRRRIEWRPAADTGTDAGHRQRRHHRAGTDRHQCPCGRRWQHVRDRARTGEGGDAGSRSAARSGAAAMPQRRESPAAAASSRSGSGGSGLTQDAPWRTSSAASST